MMSSTDISVLEAEIENWTRALKKSSEIASKVQAVVVEKQKGRHFQIRSVALADVDFPQIVLNAIEQK